MIASGIPRDLRRHLVMLPMREAHSTSGIVAQTEVAGENADGSGCYAPVTVSAGLPHTEWAITQQFRGRILGVRFNSVQVSSSGSWLKNMGCIIDGDAYPIRKPAVAWISGAALGTADGSFGLIVADDLPDNNHTVTVVFAGSNTLINQTFFYGFIVDGRAGYPRQDRYGIMTNPIAVPNASYGTVIGNMSAIRTPRALRKVIYYNPTGGAITVTIKLNNVVFWSKSVAAGATEEFDPGLAVAVNLWSTSSTYFLHQASGAGMYYTSVFAN